MTIEGRDDFLDLYSAEVKFIAQRVGWAPQRITISFHDPEGEAEEHLMALWRIWHRDTIEAARLAGGTGDIPLT